jgi:glycosyltransferase involved in cell wall biosynthesis
MIVHNRYRGAQPSGENAVVDDEAALLVDAGCEVHTVQVSSDDIADASIRDRARLPLDVVWSQRGASLIRRAIADGRPDVVHFHNTFPLLSPAAIRAAARSQSRVLLTLHNFRPLCASALFLRDGKSCEDCVGTRFALPALRHGCYRGSRAATLPVAAMGVVHRRLGTWTDGVDMILFPSAFARARYIAAGWPKEKLVVKHNTARHTGPRRDGAGTGFVAVSRLSAEKGIDVLLDAWSLREPDGSALTIVGDGEDREMLRARVAGRPDVRFVGALPSAEVIETVRRSRALVVPSRCYEVFPRVVVEAYSVGVPVIASRIGALADVVDDGVTGLHAAAGEAEELASVIARLAADDALAVRLGDGAYRRFLRSFAPDVATRRLLEIYAGKVTGGS